MVEYDMIGWLSVSIKTYPHNKQGASRSLNAFQEFGKIKRLGVQMNWKKCFDLSETQLREFRNVVSQNNLCSFSKIWKGGWYLPSRFIF